MCVFHFSTYATPFVDLLIGRNNPVPVPMDALCQAGKDVLEPFSVANIGFPPLSFSEKIYFVYSVSFF